MTTNGNRDDLRRREALSEVDGLICQLRELANRDFGGLARPGRPILKQALVSALRLRKLLEQPNEAEQVDWTKILRLLLWLAEFARWVGSLLNCMIGEEVFGLNG